MHLNFLPQLKKVSSLFAKPDLLAYERETDSTLNLIPLKAGIKQEHAVSHAIRVGASLFVIILGAIFSFLSYVDSQSQIKLLEAQKSADEVYKKVLVQQNNPETAYYFRIKDKINYYKQLQQTYPSIQKPIDSFESTFNKFPEVNVNSYTLMPSSVSVEITAYGLLTVSNLFSDLLSSGNVDYVSLKTATYDAEDKTFEISFSVVFKKGEK